MRLESAHVPDEGVPSRKSSDLWFAISWIHSGRCRWSQQKRWCGHPYQQPKWRIGGMLSKANRFCSPRAPRPVLIAVFRLPDPFAVITVDGEQTATTTAIKKTLNPYWNESFEM